MSDRSLLYLSAVLRAVATGFLGVLLGVYLARVGLDARAIGLVASAGLAGAALGACVVTLRGDRTRDPPDAPRDSTLASAAGGLALAWRPTPRPRRRRLRRDGQRHGARPGRCPVLELAALPATTSDAGRTGVIARYNILQDAGHALGSLLAGLPALVERAGLVAGEPAHRASVVAYAVLVLLPAGAYLRLSRAVEPPSRGRRPPRLPRDPADPLADLVAVCRRRLRRGLPDVDPSGLLPLRALRRGPRGDRPPLLPRPGGERPLPRRRRLARRPHRPRQHDGLHPHPLEPFPDRVGLSPTFPIAAAFQLARSLEMDVPTRQSYVMALVRPEERALASGVTHLVRVAAWAIAPGFAGLLMAGVSPPCPSWSEPVSRSPTTSRCGGPSATSARRRSGPAHT